MTQPKILVLDIETAPILARVWRTFKENVGLEQIEHDWYILSFAAKWLGSSRVTYYDQSRARDIEDDRFLLGKIWRLLDQADIVVAHNGRRFDIPKINARFITLGMLPPSPYKVHDTLDIAKRHFKFTSNRLQFLTDTLCTEKKRKSEKFPGFSLWAECLKGNQEAWAEMREYNLQDVVSLEELYLRLRAWDSRAPNIGVYIDGEEPKCPKCGSTHVQKRGHYHTNVGVYQRYRCNDCGGWGKGAVLQNTLQHRRSVLRSTV